MPDEPTTGNTLRTGSITSDKIVAGSITADKITAGSWQTFDVRDGDVVHRESVWVPAAEEDLPRTEVAEAVLTQLLAPVYVPAPPAPKQSPVDWVPGTEDFIGQAPAWSIWIFYENSRQSTRHYGSRAAKSAWESEQSAYNLGYRPNVVKIELWRYEYSPSDHLHHPIFEERLPRG